MSSLQIVSTRRPLHAALDLGFWRERFTSAAPATPMGGRIITLAAPSPVPVAALAGLALTVALVMAPMLLVGVAAASAA